ncbi:MAG: TetR/AcrR family transcriptional regulator [Brevundimonas sp.]|jgi:AcrR family transcriptional regulator|uniref:TetR/AcrR family transcriptional regulator n=1 Tax=Brevundimonas sp. TaxID=1871086 RepID=UPI0040339EA0
MSSSFDEAGAHEAKRHAILNHARDAFIVEGYAGARMEPIAREAGVSTATLYALFAGKRELFSAVIEHAADEFSRKMADVRADDGDVARRLTSFALAYAGFMSDPFVRSIFRLVMAERPRFRDTALRFFEKGRAEFGTTLIGIIDDAISRGVLKPLEGKTSWAAGQLMGMLEHPVFFVPLVTGDEIRAGRTVDSVASDAVETFLARHRV